MAQTYTGGTDVLGGTAAFGQHGTLHPFGANEGAITVGDGAVLEMNGKYHCNYYAYVLDGGTIKNSVDWNAYYNYGLIGNLSLTADSVFRTDGRYGLSYRNLSSVFTTASLDLAGHTLAFETPSAVYFVGVEATSAGTIDLYGTRLIEFRTLVSDLRRTTLIVEDGAQIRASNIEGTMLGDYIVKTTASDTSSLYGVKVYGTFKPDTDFFLGTELQDGATIDLSGRTGTFDLTGETTSTVSGADENIGTVTFADNATINVVLGSRDVSGDEPIISWTTPPANLSTLTFLRGDSAACRLTKLSDGIYLPRGMVIMFR